MVERDEKPTATDDLATALLAEAAVEITDGGVTSAIAEGGGAAEPGHVIPPTNQIAEDESMENLSVSSLLTQPEGIGPRSFRELIIYHISLQIWKKWSHQNKRYDKPLMAKKKLILKCCSLFVTQKRTKKASIKATKTVVY